MGDPEALLVRVSYRDKFGLLGMIGVLIGRKNGGAIHLTHWVMSCRAFSRRIEHHSLKYLFEEFAAETIAFDYEPTERNGPLQQFLSEMSGDLPAVGLRLNRAEFLTKAPALFHHVEVPVRA